MCKKYLMSCQDYLDKQISKQKQNMCFQFYEKKL